ncbi:hypothetical protein [Streptomyces millisiae]|uniref:Transposase n=1 Tax=Streptomyces millisiae TaxID=3075542 RepID=A0ABU2LY62_9ACTN|nr:hypothetical protein [Streptomyces sp. DSM 44918]MDT0322532.1 hypothetical protein [Streptomyces sp. DSM 44918]
MLVQPGQSLLGSKRGIRRYLGLGEDIAAGYDSDRTRGPHRMLVRRRGEVVLDISKTVVVITAKSAGCEVFGLATAGVRLA